MAKFTDEERIEKIIQVANYIIETKTSTRKAAKQFNISNATVSDWMNGLLKKIDIKKYLDVQQILNKNTPKTITDEEVKNRVLMAAYLIIQGFTVEEIAKSMEVTINVINEDLQTRLPKLDFELYTQIKMIQKQNSLENLNIGSYMTVEGQKRDNNGKFTK